MPSTKTATNPTGQLLSISGQVAQVEFLDDKPNLDDILVKQGNDQVKLFVAESISKEVFSCYVLNGSKSLVRGDTLESLGHPLYVPVGSEVLGKAYEFTSLINNPPSQSSREVKLFTTKKTSDNMIEQTVWPTGIKVIDFFTPLAKGGSLGLVGGAGVGKTLLLSEMLHNLLNQQAKNQLVSIFAGIGERAREGHDLINMLSDNGVMESVAVVTGPMGANAAIRFLSGHAALTMGEYFRDEEGKEVLMFVDNVFRFAQAGNELSILTQALPSEDGYQADLDTQMAHFHQRLYSTDKSSMSAIEAIYVPADDLQDQAIQAVMPYLDSLVILSRDIYQQGLLPAIDLLDSTSALINPGVVGESHYQTLIAAQSLLKQASSLERMASLVGESELSPENQVIYQRAKKVRYYMTQPFHVAESQTGKKGVTVPLEQTVADVASIIEGKVDQIEADKLLFIGSLDQLGGK